MKTTQKARKVLDLSLSMSAETTAKTTVTTAAIIPWKLIRTYCELELFPERHQESLGRGEGGERKDKNALRSAFVEGHKRSMSLLSTACFPGQFRPMFDAKSLQPIAVEPLATQLIKAKKLYQEMWSEFATKARQGEIFPHSLVDQIVVLGLWTYCTVGLEECLGLMSEAMGFAWRSDLSREQIALSLQQIQLCHVPRTSIWTSIVAFGPSTKRSSVGRPNSVLSFPSNPQLLHMHSMSIAQTLLINPLRRFFQDLCFRSSTSVMSWLFAVQTERTGANSRHAIESLIQRALQHRDLRRCPLVWRYCIHYYISIDDLPAAREIFQRAIQSVPFSKCLWLDGSRLQLEPREWNEILKLMELKGIRMRFLQSFSDTES